jgi:mannose-6-phosphate isomerase-like protein (cupin superfamily)
VVNEASVDATVSDGGTVASKTTIDASTGCGHLEQRVTRYAAGRSAPRSPGDRQEVMYVASGRGTIYLDGRPHEVDRDTGFYLAPGETYEVENPGPDDLVIISTSAPPARSAEQPPERRTVRYVDQQPLPASPNREFRYLVTQEVGCLDVTQFVGTIPPGRAPDHSHTYDEVIYVVEGEGVLHIGQETTPISTGTCIHLPPLLEHCLENTGSTPMRVMGVFHPAGDPASRANQ